MLLSTKAEGVSFSMVNCITASRGLIQSCEIQEVISVGLARMDLGLLQELLNYRVALKAWCASCLIAL